MKPSSRAEYRNRRHLRLRKKVQGTSERPRMSVFVSNKNMYIQFIDDMAERTLASASTKSEAAASGGKNNAGVAKVLGQLAAKVAKEKGIEQVVFDRGGFAYRGRIKVLAEAAREAGLKF